jgi:hypothetical protein
MFEINTSGSYFWALERSVMAWYQEFVTQNVTLYPFGNYFCIHKFPSQVYYPKSGGNWAKLGLRERPLSIDDLLNAYASKPIRLRKHEARLLLKLLDYTIQQEIERTPRRNRIWKSNV